MENKDENKGENMFIGMLYGNALYILTIVVACISATTIFNFLGVDFEYYGVYLGFFIGLAILSQILPNRKPNLFVKTPTQGINK